MGGYRSISTAATGTGTGDTTSVPAGVLASDVIALCLYTTSVDLIGSFTVPTGFGTPVRDTGATNAATRGREIVWTKRIAVNGDATDEGDGDYDVSWTTSADYTLQAVAFSDVYWVGDPVDTSAFAASTNSTATTIGTVITTTRKTHMLMVASNHAPDSSSGSGWTAPSGYTQRSDDSTVALARQAVFTADDQAPAGTTPIATLNGTSVTYPRVIEVAFVTDGVRPHSTGITAGATNGGTLTNAPHQSGARLFHVITGKPNGLTPSLSQGFTLVGSGDGGTGSQGVDTGQTFVWVFAKDCTTSSETNPVLTAVGLNTATHVSYAFMPGWGKTWAESIATSAPWVKLGDDTDDTNGAITTTFGTLTNQPTTGDAMWLVAGFPHDLASAITSSSVTGTGLSAQVYTHNYIETSTANDSATMASRVTDFSGPVSGALTGTITSNFATGGAGAIALIALRQSDPATNYNGTASIAETATLTSAGVVGATTTATVAATDSLTASGFVGAVVAASLAATCAITATGVVGTASDASLSATATLSAEGSVQAANESGAEVNGTATLTAVGEVGTSSDAAVSGSASVTATGATGTSASAAISATATITAAGSVSAPGGTGATITATVTITAEGAVVSYDTDTSDRDDGLDLDGTALVEWSPAVVTTPARYSALLAFDTARAIVLTGIGPTGQPVITESHKAKVRATDRILLGGIDITFWRGVKTPTPDFRLIKPLLWGSGTLTLPQVNPAYERLGDDATDPVLQRVKDGAQVVVQRRNGSTVVGEDYVGFIDAINASGRELTLSLGGHASGRASRDEVPTPVFRRKHDVQFQVLSYLRTLNLRTARGGEVGISLYDRGGSDGLSYVNELVSLAVTSTGVAYDVMPTGRVYDMVATDRETIDATFYADDNLATLNVDRAFSEEPNIVYATGRTQRGELINGMRAPGLTQGVAPDWPGLLEVGDSNSDVAVIREQLSIHGALNYDDSADPELFDGDLFYAVEQLQEEAGLTVTGAVNQPTWKAAWNLELGGGFSIDRTRIFPMAWRSYTHKWFFSANGSKIGRNPNWLPHRIKTAVSLDEGLTGFNRHRIKRFARSRLAPSDVSNWQGTLNLRSGVIIGEHTPGDAITADDVMPARALRPGMNLWAPLFDGGTLFHVSGVEVSDDGAAVSVIVDTQARNTMPAWEAITRRRETRNNHARQWSGQTRVSSLRRDTLTDWTDICGYTRKRALVGGSWTEVEISAGQEGIVQEVYAELEDAAEFALLLTQRSVSVDLLNARVPTPLTDPRPSNRPWWESDTIAAWLERRGMLNAWGTEKNPCGYGRSPKEDELGPTGVAVKGWFRETAGLNYIAANPGRLYVYVWVASDNNLMPGRILTQQLTAAV